MITDMGQQCRIIESILSNFDWFFSQEKSEEQVSLEFKKKLQNDERKYSHVHTYPRWNLWAQKMVNKVWRLLVKSINLDSGRKRRF
jgi:hypothetical protein